MKRAIILLISTSFLLVTKLQAQDSKLKTKIDSDKSAYEKTFSKELGEESEPLPNYQHILDLIPEMLPVWAQYGTNTKHDTIWVTGISDPGLDSIQARAQALMRAKALIAFTSKTRHQYISDDFTKLAELGRLKELSAKYQDFTQITATLNYNSQQIVCSNYHRTKYGETLLKVGFFPKADSLPTNTIMANLETLNIYVESMQTTEKITNIRFSITDKQADTTLSDLLTSERVNRGLSITRSFNDSIHKSFRRKAHYFSLPQNKDTTQTHPGFDAVYGLWHGLMEGLSFHISNAAIYLPTLIKNTTDIYTAQNDYLIRTVASNQLDLAIQTWWVEDNDIEMQISATNINSLLPKKTKESEHTEKKLRKQTKTTNKCPNKTQY